MKPTVDEMFNYIKNNLCKNISAFEISPNYSRSRFDVIEIFRQKRRIKIYEVKSCRADFTSDNKWQKYLKYCTNFGFVAPEGVIKINELPPKVGLVEIKKHKNGQLTHNYIRNFKRINKKISDDVYIQVLEGLVSSLAWRTRGDK